MRRTRPSLPALLLLLLLAAGACGGPTPESPGSAPAAAAADGPADPAGHSVYRLPGTWRDQTGTPLSLGELAGRPRVVAFAYTSCAFACPRIVARMKGLEAATSDEVGFVLVSIDPERDTPERLADFARSSGLGPARWTLLSGDDDRILELSVLLGVKYRATGGGDFAHANVLTLLDRHGVPVERVEGLEADVDGILARLEG